MSIGKINPFDATGSILNELPDDHEVRRVMEDRLRAPVERSALIDFATAQTTINVTIAAALVALRKRDDVELERYLMLLLEQAQKMANTVGDLTAKLMIQPDPYIRRGQGDGDA